MKVRRLAGWLVSPQPLTAIKLRYCRTCYPLSPTPPPEGGGAFLPSPLQGEGPGERVFWLNLMAVKLELGNEQKVMQSQNNFFRST